MGIRGVWIDHQEPVIATALPANATSRSEQRYTLRTTHYARQITLSLEELSRSLDEAIEERNDLLTYTAYVSTATVLTLGSGLRNLLQRSQALRAGTPEAAVIARELATKNQLILFLTSATGIASGVGLYRLSLSQNQIQEYRSSITRLTEIRFKNRSSGTRIKGLN